MSPAKTLYVRDADLAVWERAEAVAKAVRQSVSQVVATALSYHLARRVIDGIYVTIRIDDGREPVTFTDSDGRPILEYGRTELGYGWKLWTDESHGGVDDHFIPGSYDVPPISEAHAWLARRFEADKEERGMETTTEDQKITVVMANGQRGFIGRWLVEPDPSETRSAEATADSGAYYGVAVTKKGNIVVYAAHVNDRWEPVLKTYGSLGQAELDGIPKDIIERAANNLDPDHVVWLDV